MSEIRATKKYTKAERLYYGLATLIKHEPHDDHIYVALDKFGQNPSIRIYVDDLSEMDKQFLTNYEWQIVDDRPYSRKYLVIFYV